MHDFELSVRFGRALYAEVDDKGEAAARGAGIGQRGDCVAVDEAYGGVEEVEQVERCGTLKGGLGEPNPRAEFLVRAKVLVQHKRIVNQKERRVELSEGCGALVHERVALRLRVGVDGFASRALDGVARLFQRWHRPLQVMAPKAQSDMREGGMWHVYT